MKLDKVLIQGRMVRSRTEAQRVIKQGAVSVGGCEPSCTFFDTGKCTCGGWKKITDPTQDIPSGTAVKFGDGSYRLEKRLDGSGGYDQLAGVTRVPEGEPDINQMAAQIVQKTTHE